MSFTIGRRRRRPFAFKHLHIRATYKKKATTASIMMIIATNTARTER